MTETTKANRRTLSQRYALATAADLLTGADYDIGCAATRLEEVGLADEARRVDALMEACIALREEFRADSRA